MTVQPIQILLVEDSAADVRLTREALGEPATRPDDAERYDWECRVGNKEQFLIGIVAATTAEAQALADEQAEWYLKILEVMKREHGPALRHLQETSVENIHYEDGDKT